MISGALVIGAERIDSYLGARKSNWFRPHPIKFDLTRAFLKPITALVRVIPFFMLVLAVALLFLWPSQPAAEQVNIKTSGKS